MKDFAKKALGDHWKESGYGFEYDGIRIQLMSSVQVHPERKFTSVAIVQFWQGPYLLVGEMENCGVVLIAQTTAEGNFDDIVVPALYDIGLALAIKAKCKFNFDSQKYIANIV